MNQQWDTVSWDKRGQKTTGVDAKKALTTALRKGQVVTTAKHQSTFDWLFCVIDALSSRIRTIILSDIFWLHDDDERFVFIHLDEIGNKNKAVGIASAAKLENETENFKSSFPLGLRVLSV